MQDFESTIEDPAVAMGHAVRSTPPINPFIAQSSGFQYNPYSSNPMYNQYQVNQPTYQQHQQHQVNQQYYPPQSVYHQPREKYVPERAPEHIQQRTPIKQVEKQSEQIKESSENGFNYEKIRDITEIIFLGILILIGLKILHKLK